MLLQTTSHQNRPSIVFPFVLHITTAEVYLLQGITIVTQNLVAELVIRILGTCAEVGVHQTTRVGETILRTRDGDKVGGLAIGVGVVVGAEIAIAGDVLETGVGAQKMLVIGAIHVPLGAEGVYVVLELLGEWRLVWLEAVDAKTAAAELRSVVVLGCDLAVVRSLEVGTEAHGGGIEMRDIGIAVLVAVVLLAVALHTEKEDTRLLVLCYHASIHAGVDVVGALLGESAAVADTKRVAVRLLGDDVDCTTDRR